MNSDSLREEESLSQTFALAAKAEVLSHLCTTVACSVTNNMLSSKKLLKVFLKEKLLKLSIFVLMKT